MLSGRLRNTLIALVASAVSVAANPSLSLKVSTPSVSDGVAGLKVITTIINTGDETLKLLNDPRGALSNFPEDTFSITSASGSSPAFIGAKAKYAYSPDTKDFTILTPGQSVAISHDLAAAYNFTGTGEGIYTIEPSNLFTYVDAAGDLVDIRAANEFSEVDLSGVLSTSRLEKRVTFSGCSASQQTQIIAAANAANTLVSSTYSYVVGLTSGTPRYTTWFGTYTTARHTTVVNHFTHLYSNNFTTFLYDCTCTDSGTYAYVYPSEYGVIYLCGGFWALPTTGTDSKAGTLVYEALHWTVNGGLVDYIYGQSAAKALALSNPAQAVQSLSNHEYFVENTPALA